MAKDNEIDKSILMSILPGKVTIGHSIVEEIWHEKI